MRTAGMAVLADAAEIIKSCFSFFFFGRRGGKGRRCSGELGKSSHDIMQLLTLQLKYKN